MAWSVLEGTMFLTSSDAGTVGAVIAFPVKGVEKAKNKEQVTFKTPGTY